MVTTFSLAAGPCVLLLLFAYIKDKYEKEPLILLGMGVFFGFITIMPILATNIFLMKTNIYIEFPVITKAFITSAFNEEFFKFIFLFFLIFKNPNFNEPIDGIVYSIFISLGFALGENLIYVFDLELGGIETALLRGITAVPAHGTFAIIMGYFFAKWKYLKEGNANLFLSFFAPFLAHGIYNFILLADFKNYLLFFLPYLLIIYTMAFCMFKELLNISPFKFLKKR